MNKKLLVFSLAAVATIAVISLYGVDWSRYIKRQESNITKVETAIEKFKAIADSEGTVFTDIQRRDAQTNLDNALKELESYKTKLFYYKGRLAIDNKDYDEAVENIGELKEIGTSTAITRAKSLNSKLPSTKRVTF